MRRDGVQGDKERRSATRKAKRRELEGEVNRYGEKMRKSWEVTGCRKVTKRDAVQQERQKGWSWKVK